jgi:hypothetical protein
MTSAKAAAAERVIVHKMSSKFDPQGQVLIATFRVGDLKLHVGFPGEDKSAFDKDGHKCNGGCWCPPPDPKTGVRVCVGPTQPPYISLSGNGDEHGTQVTVTSANDPPSTSCAAACNITSCASSAVAGGSAKVCVTCLLSYNANHSGALIKAGCRVPPTGKDIKHWCNNAVDPPAPSPSPGPPSPSPAPTPLPCVASPCLFNITVRSFVTETASCCNFLLMMSQEDPLEEHDLASAMPQMVKQLREQLQTYRQQLVQSPFPGGHNNTAACAYLNRTGMWGPFGGDGSWEGGH